MAILQFHSQPPPKSTPDTGSQCIERLSVAVSVGCGWRSVSLWHSVVQCRFCLTSLILLLSLLSRILTVTEWVTVFVNNQLDTQLFLLYLFNTILYMFRATKCSSWEESIVPIRPLLYVTLKKVEWSKITKLYLKTSSVFLTFMHHASYIYIYIYIYIYRTDVQLLPRERFLYI